MRRYTSAVSFIIHNPVHGLTYEKDIYWIKRNQKQKENFDAVKCFFADIQALN